ncbi:MAG TPA: hypothetical protein PKE04_08455, partial [Clostridia bacterium]|nr:hypothetical protein [Clostridia bacterium]
MLVEERYFDENGNPVALPKGYASCVYVRDDSGRITEQSYYGADGAPAALPDGYSRIRYTHDRAGLVETVTY